MDEQEKRDIETMRVIQSAVHVEDWNALEQFNNGKLLFDVTLHGEKLSNFVNRHPEIQASIRKDASGHFPRAVSFLDNHRPVYFGVKSK